ncbi:uncharacterized protein LOC131327903 [Rhododendron vialii]|uniref:uncharacterized protein LOC131327903 n=1 Tax=Rhododendron vialii TaxID=182163 RepID=UPI00265F3CE4|nr:uncharacterized protein LOC131327903 [Rhododendron vialii]
MEGVKERYGKASTEEVEYEEGEVEYDRAGGVINCRETVVPMRGDDTSFVINNRRYTLLWRYFWLDEYSCGKGRIECAAGIGNPREGIPEEMPRRIGKKGERFCRDSCFGKGVAFCRPEVVSIKSKGYSRGDGRPTGWRFDMPDQTKTFRV